MLSTEMPTPPGMITAPTVDGAKFSAWQSSSLRFLENLLGINDSSTQKFRSEVCKSQAFRVKIGIGLLQAVRDDLTAGRLTPTASPTESALAVVERLCERFHLLAKQLRQRRDSRPTLDVSDEYDVQDLLHAILRLHFDDIRPEEYVPSYAGSSTRMDFLLKREQTVIEVKKTRPGLTTKEVGSQLIEDIAHYANHPDCGTLICFVYDPDGRIQNARGLESDLAKPGPPMRVAVFIRPA